MHPDFFAPHAVQPPAHQPAHVVYITPGDHVLIPLAAALFGYTEKAIQRKIQEGIWVEGLHWRRAPDSRIVIIRKGVEEWFTQSAGLKSVRKASALRSHGTASLAVKL
jgi:hypothetical protein